MHVSHATPDELQEHMARTYFSLRIGMGGVAAALPPLLWAGGRLADHESLRCSMSAYYYSPAMRDVFVGALCAIGVFLYLYKGFSKQENWALNAAGLFVIGVALEPTSPTCPEGAGFSMSVHGALAVLFFLSIAYVCLFRAGDTLALLQRGDPAAAKRFQRVYQALGALMAVSPGTAVILTAVLQPDGHARSLVFFVEAVAVLTFAAYWIVKSREMSRTEAEALALERRLARHPVVADGVRRKVSPGRLEQVA